LGILGLLVLIGYLSGKEKDHGSGNSRSNSSSSNNYTSHTSGYNPPSYPGTTWSEPTKPINVATPQTPYKPSEPQEDQSFHPFITEKTLRSYVSPAVFRRAWDQIYRGDRVGKISKNGNTFSANVESSRGYTSYWTTVTIVDGQIISYDCNCPAGEEYNTPCKHVIGLALEANVTHFSKAVPVKPQVIESTPAPVVSKPVVKKAASKKVVAKRKTVSKKRTSKPKASETVDWASLYKDEDFGYPSIHVGDYVIHQKFGTGKIIEDDGDMFKVSFPGLDPKLFEYPGAFTNGFLTKK
jgi:hypothetical protein